MKENGKRLRQYAGILAAVVSYYLIHEGAHLVAALLMGSFRAGRFMGIGVQIVVDDAGMTDTQLGIFCLVGAVATLLAGWAMSLGAEKLCRISSKLLRACLYYITLAFLLLDPIYLCLLSGLVGGGDMNGIQLLIPKAAAVAIFAVLLVCNGLIFWKRVLPTYTKSFQ